MGLQQKPAVSGGLLSDWILTMKKLQFVCIGWQILPIIPISWCSEDYAKVQACCTVTNDDDSVRFIYYTNHEKAKLCEALS